MIASAPLPPVRAPVRPRPLERPLRVAFLVPEDRQTGTYFRSHNLAIALRETGCEVTVYSQSNDTRWASRTETRDDVRYVFCPTVPGNRVLMSPIHPGNIMRRLFAHVAPADVYHLFQPFPSAALPWLALKERRPGLFAYDWDDFWMNEEFGLLRPRNFNTLLTALWVRYLERMLPGRADLLTTLSHELAGLAHRWHSAHTTLVYNGVWLEPPLDQRAARAQLGLRPNAIYAGMMGWTGETRWALDGLRHARAKFPQLRLAWCGGDPSAALREYPDLAGAVDSLGFLPHEKLKAFRAAQDIGIIPMSDSAFNRFRLPYKLTDFLSAGTPVLASAVGETAILARRLSGVLPAPCTRDGWIRAFGAAVAELANGGPSERPVREQLTAEFQWTAIARRITANYHAGLARQSDAT